MVKEKLENICFYESDYMSLVIIYNVFACRDGPDDIRCFCVPYTMMNVSESGNFTHRKQVVSQSLIQKLHIKGGTCLLSIINSRIC